MYRIMYSARLISEMRQQSARVLDGRRRRGDCYAISRVNIRQTFDDWLLFVKEPMYLNKNGLFFSKPKLLIENPLHNH